MGEAHKAVCQRVDFSNTPACPNSDNLSWAMYKFIEPIREVSLIGDKTSIFEAYKLMRWRRAFSWNSMLPGQGERAPDESADELLAALVRKWDRCDEKIGTSDWWLSELKDLQKQVDDVAKHGIHSWYPETIKAIREALKASKAAEAVKVKTEASA
ncbi:hypothetical protein QBC41DRAFT_338940 [Cercophora samala]|uniref:Uncharacterized protein n=1 Tax=Cercophora samala TaxID=330535 RepID=A0AA39Z9A8_9PEZI|nr:hypothetical protein QBC41DRAFT_338940 [Cercophora samala]